MSTYRRYSVKITNGHAKLCDRAPGSSFTRRCQDHGIGETIARCSWFSASRAFRISDKINIESSNISMDEFAQTRGADDLFEDDFTPIAEALVQGNEPQPQISPRGGHNGPTPRRGNRVQDSFSRQSRQKTTTQSPQSHVAVLSDESLAQNAPSSEGPGPDFSTSPQPDGLQPQAKPPTAVRGDRAATGGTPKPKLTEEELSARLAAAKLNNAKRAEAHRLAEADEASFQQREAHASQKRKEEGQAKRVMNMEREKNRLRKLGAQAGREWDEGKEDLERREESVGQYRRGAHGGVAYEARRGGRERGHGERPNGYQNGDYDQDFHERRGSYRGRGRSDRGRGRGRGRGVVNPISDVRQTPPDPVADFPALPNTAKSTQVSQVKPLDTSIGPTTGESWADEVQAAKSPDG